MQPAKHFKYLATANDTATVTGRCRLERIVVATGAASATVTVYDNTAASGDVVTLVNGAAAISLNYGGIVLSNMHVVLAGGNAKVTIVYS